MIEAMPAQSVHLPLLEKTFHAFWQKKQAQASSYLTYDGLADFHWQRLENDILADSTPQPHIFMEKGHPVGIAKIQSSKWHTGHFGFPHYKIQPFFSFCEDLETSRAMIHALKTLFPKEHCVINTRLDSTDCLLNYAVSESGFVSVGTSIRMIHSTNKSLKVDTLQSNQYDRLNIRIFRHDDLPLLQEMIIRCHKHSHFFREPRFQLEESKKLFAGWMEKCAKGLAERIYIAEDNNKLLGFCSLLSNKSLLNFINKKIGIIDFIVVDESAQGRGVGKSLLNTAFSFFQEFDFIELRTMADNIGAIRFYQKNGFFILSADEYYHFWT